MLKSGKVGYVREVRYGKVKLCTQIGRQINKEKRTIRKGGRERLERKRSCVCKVGI